MRVREKDHLLSSHLPFLAIFLLWEQNEGICVWEFISVVCHLQSSSKTIYTRLFVIYLLDLYPACFSGKQRSWQEGVAHHFVYTRIRRWTGLREGNGLIELFSSVFMRIKQILCIRTLVHWNKKILWWSWPEQNYHFLHWICNKASLRKVAPSQSSVQFMSKLLWTAE